MVVGKPGPNQGKVFVVQGKVDPTGIGLWLWDPAAPSAVEPSPYDDVLSIENVACCGHSSDGEGDLILSGGDKTTPCGPEPTWSYIYHPDQWFVQATTFMRTPPPPMSPLPPDYRFGYYYPTTVALHDGSVGSFGGGSAPWRSAAPPGGCGYSEPLNSQLSANYWQRFNKANLSWDGPSGSASPFAGLPGGYTFSYYPRMNLLSSGDLFVSYQMYGGWDPNSVTPTTPLGRNYSVSAFADVSTNPSGWSTAPPAWVIQPSKLQYAYSSTGHPWAGLGPKTVNLVFGSAILWPYRVGEAGLMPWDGTGWFDRTLVIGGFDDQPQPGGAGFPMSSPFNDPAREAHNAVWEITNPLTGAWTIPASYGAMANRRVFCNTIITPDLKLIVFGGCTHWYCPYGSGGFQVDPNPVYVPEMLDLLNPAAGWTSLTLTPHASARLYHSIALLLKDGRIVVGSGHKSTINTPPNPPLTHTDAEVFTPPCLQQGLARPTIANAQSEINDIHYGVAIPELKISLQGSSNPATEIEFATLIRCGSVTHHFDADQRCIKLELLEDAGNRITLAPLPSQAQGGHFIAPPGYYYLFVVTTPRGSPQVRVPSVARFVRIS